MRRTELSDHKTMALVLSKPCVVTVLYPGCIFFELALALELLAGKYDVVLTTPDGKDHVASNGSVLRINTDYQNTDLTNASAVLVPGGNPDSIKDNTDIDMLLRKASEKKLVIGAICAGPSVLAKAGILKGKSIAHGYGAKQLEHLRFIFEDVTLTEKKFVWDGNILTAKPDAHIDFAVEFAARLGAIEASMAARLKDYYRGVL